MNASLRSAANKTHHGAHNLVKSECAVSQRKGNEFSNVEKRLKTEGKKQTDECLLQKVIT